MQLAGPIRKEPTQHAQVHHGSALQPQQQHAHNNTIMQLHPADTLTEGLYNPSSLIATAPPPRTCSLQTCWPVALNVGLHCCQQPPQHADMRGGSSPSAGLSQCTPRVTTTACRHRRCGMLLQEPPFFAQLPAKAVAHTPACNTKTLARPRNHPKPDSCHSQYLLPPEAALRPQTSEEPTGHGMHLDNISYWQTR